MTDRSATSRVSDAGGFELKASASAPAVTSPAVTSAALTTLTLSAQGRVSTLLGGSRILFDGVAAPMIYTSAGKTTTIAIFEYNGLRSDPVVLPVVPAAPGFLSVDFSGKNQVAALNEDGSVNSAGNPTGAGKLIVLYGTGAGTFKTPPVDGAAVCRAGTGAGERRVPDQRARAGRSRAQRQSGDRDEERVDRIAAGDHDCGEIED